MILVTTDPFHEDRSMAIASDLVADAVADADPDLAHHGLVDGALLREGGGRRGAGPHHRLQPPGVAARTPERHRGRQLTGVVVAGVVGGVVGVVSAGGAS